MIYRHHVAVGDSEPGGVFITTTGFVLFQGSSVEKAFERRRAEMDGEFTGISFERRGAQIARGI